MTSDAQARKRHRVMTVQRWLLNPPMRAFVWLGLVPGHMIIETRGHRTGRTRRTVVGTHRDGDQFWVVAEQGRYAGWVRNLVAQPRLRIRHRARWHDGRATIVDGDDSLARLDTWSRPGHARVVRAVGTDLTTILIDVSEVGP